MNRSIAIVLAAATLLGGCAVYATPVPTPVPGVYVGPPPVVVAPGPVWGGWHWRGPYRGWHARAY